ncbi:MAG: VOC family protein [Ruminiclostridium sp.]|nr:VOC family protein [Ruminiclostridium sp.]
MTAMSHVCIRVLDLEKSIAFYKETLGLTIQREISMPDRGWELVFLEDGTTGYQLELCKETARTEPYGLGDDTPHIGLVAQDFDSLKAKHKAAGLIFDELNGTIYFIKDPDGHILEILPPK